LVENILVPLPAARITTSMNIPFLLKSQLVKRLPKKKVASATFFEIYAFCLADIVLLLLYLSQRS
jgi:hypothetical protein